MNGIVYIALADSAYLAMTLMSIESLRASGCTAPITVISDINVRLWPKRIRLGYSVLRLCRTRGSAMQAVAMLKTRLLELSPYKRTLLLDSDVLILRNISAIWSGAAPLSIALDACATLDIVRAIAPGWTSAANWDKTIAMLGPGGLHFNIGILRLDRDDNIRLLLDKWLQEITASEPYDVDQIAFLRALAAHPVPLHVLDPTYSYSVRRFHPSQVVVEDPHIVHYNGIARPHADRLMQDGYEQLMRGIIPSYAQRPPAVHERS